MTSRWSRRNTDWWIAGLFFAAFALVGGAYVRAFDRTDARVVTDTRMLPERAMWFGQREFGAAVAMACGRGFVDPGYDLTPGLAAFLTLKQDSFSCDELPATLPSTEPNVTQRLYRYLMWATAIVWRIGGVSWSGLWPLFALLYGATVSICYGLFRMGTGRALACAAALAIGTSAVHLSNLPGLRDYAKAPFILGLILIAAHLATEIDRPRRLMALSALFGAVLGIGFGFRNDILIVVPIYVAALMLWKPPGELATIRRRTIALALAAATFAVAALPIVRAYGRGSNSGHVALLGLMPAFDQRLGISGSIYEWGYGYRDEYAVAVINSYTTRVHGHPVAYLSSEYDRAMVEYIGRIARNWPADMMARGYGAVLRVIDLPGTGGNAANVPPYGIQSGSLRRWYEWQIGAVGLLEDTGLAAVLLALVVVSASSPWQALLLFAGVLYVAGYPAIQFQIRHVFHLEFIHWLALGFLAQMAITARAKIPLPRAVGNMALFAAMASAVVLLPFLGARAYQDRHQRSFLRQYLEAADDPVAIEPIPMGEKTLLRVAPSTTAIKKTTAIKTVTTDYIVATVNHASCSAVRLPITFRYRSAEARNDFSYDTTLVLAADHDTTRVFFPAYSVEGETRFEGVEVPIGCESCIREISRIRDLARFPILLDLTVTADWEKQPLYQTLTAWETSTAPGVAEARILTIPESLPVERATLAQSPEAARVSWRTPIVRGEPSAQWTLVGTPRGVVWPALQFSPEPRTPDDRFIVEGEVERGGVTLGLVQDDRWVAEGNLTIATPGPFVAVLAPSSDGSYGVQFTNSLQSSWLFRHTPEVITGLAGRFHDFNVVRIAKAGWVRK
jgi:hypothetical protein